MQKPFEFLDIPNHSQVSEEMLQFVEQHTDIVNDCPQFWNPVDISTVLAHVPSLKHFLAQIKLIPIQISVIVFDPSTMYTRIHSDPLDTYVRLLWPVKNCLGSVTRFYDIPQHLMVEGNKTEWKDISKKHLDHYTNVDQGVYYPPLNSEWPVIDQLELSAPVAFDGSVPHGVYPAAEPGIRISFSVFFDPNLPISKYVKAWPTRLLKLHK